MNVKNFAYLDHGEDEADHGQNTSEHLIVLPVLEVLDIPALHPPLNLFLYLLPLFPLYHRRRVLMRNILLPHAPYRVQQMVGVSAHFLNILFYWYGG